MAVLDERAEQLYEAVTRDLARAGHAANCWSACGTTGQQHGIACAEAANRTSDQALRS